MSRMRTRLVLGVGVVAAAAVWTVMPAAHAATSGGTSVTFNLTSSGTLSISVPGTATIPDLTLQSLTGNFTSTGALGTTTVTDDRNGLAVTDTVTATSTDFAGSTNNPGIPAADASLSSGTVTFSGGMTAVTGTPLSGTNLASPGQQVMLGVTTGTGSATYNPSLTVTVPSASAIVDSYTGTVTQTVS